MVEGEMKEISEEMLEALNLLTNTSKSNSLNCVCKLLLVKKKFVLTKEKEKMKLFTQSKRASYDKIYAIASKGSSKQERTAAFEEVKEEVKHYLEEELAENGDLVSKYFTKQTKKQFVT
jgi:polyribonucleotide nucleotidyltransferase